VPLSRATRPGLLCDVLLDQSKKAFVEIRIGDGLAPHGPQDLRHPILGPIAFDYSAFAVDGRPDLSMVVYNPVTPADAQKIRSLTGSARAVEQT
jgi:hypothetical protein